MKERRFNIGYRDSSTKNEYYKWDFVDDDGRELIREWSRNRIKKMKGLQKSYYGFLVYSFNWGVIKNFIMNFNVMVILQMLLAAGAVYLFEYFDIEFNFHVSLFVSPIVFPLAFSINTDFQRREKVLDDLASFKSSAMIWYFCMREWKHAAELDEAWLNAVHLKVKSMMFNLREYLLTDKNDRRRVILRYMYEDFSDTNQLIERVRASKLPANTSIISRVIHLLNNMCLSFERLRVVREYRSPRSIRSFNKVLILLLPIILCPYFVHLGKHAKSNNKWCSYFIAVLVAAVFGALQGVQDKLDDPFDGMSADDINLDTIDEWTFNSLENTVGRMFTVGRFHVETKVDRTDSMISRVKTTMEESTSTHSKKPTVRRQKSIRSVFSRAASRRDTKRQANVRRASTFNKVFHRQESTNSTYSFVPESHPYANILEKMSGNERVGRSGSVFVAPGDSFVNFLNDTPSPTPSIDIPYHNHDDKRHSTTSLTSILKDDNSQVDKKATVSFTASTKRGSESRPKTPLNSISEDENDQRASSDKKVAVKFSEETEVFGDNTTSATQVLLPHETNHNGRFNLTKVQTSPKASNGIELQETGKSRESIKDITVNKSTANGDSELHSILVIGDSNYLHENTNISM